MFIELTDHLRCVESHPEAFLVLVPGTMAGRRVLSGTLGCPVCQAEYPILDGIARLGTEPSAAGAPAVPGPEAAALLAFLGLDGPGGYLALLGEAGRAAPGIAEALPGVHLVAVNPPAGVVFRPEVSVVRASRMPLKARSLRGVVVGDPFGRLPDWSADAVRAVLPGLRATGGGPEPALPEFELLGAADGWWVGVRR